MLLASIAGLIVFIIGIYNSNFPILAFNQARHSSNQLKKNIETNQIQDRGVDLQFRVVSFTDLLMD
jgi:hypothetical protein